MKTFTIETQTIPAADFLYAGNQRERAETLKADRIF